MRRESRSTAWGTKTAHGAHWTLRHRICLTLRIVRIGDTVDNKLRLFTGYLYTVHQRQLKYVIGGSRTFVVCLDISEVISAVIMCLADAHRVVREVDIAIVALFVCQLDARRQWIEAWEPTEE